MVANLIKPLLVVFVFLVVMNNSERQFATAKSVPNVEVRTSSTRELQEVEDRCKAKYSVCGDNLSCCSRQCYFLLLVAICL